MSCNGTPTPVLLRRSYLRYILQTQSFDGLLSQHKLLYLAAGGHADSGRRTGSSAGSSDG